MFGIRFFLFLDSELSQPRTPICFEKVPFAPGPLLFSLIEQLSQYFLRFVFCFSTTCCAFRLYFVPSKRVEVKFPKFVIPQWLPHVGHSRATRLTTQKSGAGRISYQNCNKIAMLCAWTNGSTETDWGNAFVGQMVDAISQLGPRYGWDVEKNLFLTTSLFGNAFSNCIHSFQFSKLLFCVLQHLTYVWGNFYFSNINISWHICI